MKKVFTMLVMSIFLLSFMSTAVLALGSDIGHLDHGKTTPDSLFWGIDVAMDNLALAFASGTDAKVAKGLEIAEERLAEARTMGLEGKFKAMSKAENAHGKTMLKLELELEEINGGDPIKELKTKLEFKQKIKQHDDLVEDVENELRIKIEIEGEITPEQQALIDEILANLDGQTGEVEIKIDNEIGKTKIEIEVETGQSGDKIEIEIKIELGIDDKEDASEEIADAKEEIARAEVKIAEAQADGKETSAAKQFLSDARDKLLEARIAFDKGNFEDAEELADDAEDLAGVARMKALGKTLDEMGDSSDDSSSDDSSDDGSEDSSSDNSESGSGNECLVDLDCDDDEFCDHGDCEDLVDDNVIVLN